MRSYSIKAYCCHWYVIFVQYHIINLEILADAFLIFTKWLADITVRAQYFYLSSTYHNRNFLTVREHSFPLSYDKSSLPFIKKLVSSFFGKKSSYNRYGYYWAYCMQSNRNCINIFDKWIGGITMMTLFLCSHKQLLFG